MNISLAKIKSNLYRDLKVMWHFFVCDPKLYKNYDFSKIVQTIKRMRTGGYPGNILRLRVLIYLKLK